MCAVVHYFQIVIHIVLAVLQKFSNSRMCSTFLATMLADSSVDNLGSSSCSVDHSRDKLHFAVYCSSFHCFTAACYRIFHGSWNTPYVYPRQPHSKAVPVDTKYLFPALWALRLISSCIILCKQFCLGVLKYHNHFPHTICRRTAVGSDDSIC